MPQAFKQSQSSTPIQAQALSETTPGFQPYSESDDRSRTSRQYHRVLPLRMRWQRLWAKQRYRGYTLWCEVRSLFHRIRNPRSRTEFLSPSQYLDTTLGRAHPLKRSATVASIRCIKSVEAEMPWVSLFDMSLVMQGWAEGAAWGVRTASPHTDSGSEQSGTLSCDSAFQSNALRAGVSRHA
jgi:hypothetical protein